MGYFHGVYLQNTAISTALDLVRFFAEPDSVRFSHITLRGPYERRLSEKWLRNVGDDPRFEWKVFLIEPGHFFDTGQTTVFLKIDLMSLKYLCHKPDFPNAIPHLTLYDGNDKFFAHQLFDLTKSFEWYISARVSKLRQIDKKAKIDEVFLPFVESFVDGIRKYIDDPSDWDILDIRSLPKTKRLNLIESVLSDTVGFSSKALKRA